jgi:hypothetical protein
LEVQAILRELRVINRVGSSVWFGFLVMRARAGVCMTMMSGIAVIIVVAQDYDCRSILRGLAFFSSYEVTVAGPKQKHEECDDCEPKQYLEHDGHRINCFFANAQKEMPKRSQAITFLFRKMSRGLPVRTQPWPAIVATGINAEKSRTSARRSMFGKVRK